MPFNGTGTFVRVYNWTTDASNGILVRSDRMDTETDGIATGLSNCITKDGQQTLTANIPFSGFKITGLGNGASPQDATTVAQVFTSPTFASLTATGVVTMSGATSVFVPTATTGDNSTKAASTAFVTATAFSAALPAQAGNSGKLITTDGATASWTSVKTVGGQSIVGSGDISTGMILLATLTPTAAASVDALTTFTSSYDNYIIIGTGLSVSADDTFRFRFAVAGSVDSGSNYYTADSYSVAALTASATSGIVASTTTSAGIGANFSMRIYNANDATRLKTTFSEHNSQSAATPAYIIRGAATVYTAANAVSGIRFFLNGGNNFGATGKIRIYGFNNS